MSGKRARRYLQRQHLIDLGPMALAYLTELTHRRPRQWIADIEHLHQLLGTFGDAVIDWTRAVRERRIVDLAALTNGGAVLNVSDRHFGTPNHMLLPGRARYMGDGWETQRRRGPGYDWAIVRLGAPGIIRKVEIDTNHYKGNYPDSASLEACVAPGASANALASATWMELLPRTQLRAHHRHLSHASLGKGLARNQGSGGEFRQESRRRCARSGCRRPADFQRAH